MGYESVQEMFSRMAGEFSSKTAIDRGSRRITYGELEAESNRLANFLLQEGVTTGTMVAIFTEDPIRIITSMLGVLKAGASRHISGPHWGIFPWSARSSPLSQ